MSTKQTELQDIVDRLFLRRYGDRFQLAIKITVSNLKPETGQVKVTTNLDTGKAYRVRSRETSRDLVGKYAPGIDDKHQQQLQIRQSPMRPQMQT